MAPAQKEEADYMFFCMCGWSVKGRKKKISDRDDLPATTTKRRVT
jgi:hypothetical protein